MKVVFASILTFTLAAFAVSAAPIGDSGAPGESAAIASGEFPPSAPSGALPSGIEIPPPPVEPGELSDLEDPSDISGSGDDMDCGDFGSDSDDFEDASDGSDSDDGDDQSADLGADGSPGGIARRDGSGRRPGSHRKQKGRACSPEMSMTPLGEASGSDDLVAPEIPTSEAA
ncbi:hypothetical protein IW140_003092 [Coemansia sp. RSA 1813]|nr:hypothetical protein EV178_003001 [Coemansia sp. RSA 1646]KAJ1769214.1 hypothetical protein LPJ74_004213 [Coemansia sp. RSA 1843]KAJ2089523.1 hypothetical protein IW138_003412 [Coemansia sp. RSA 986]KAJ2214507.1 hypothetical protein EV179_002912 [Coemansia sp. RSA 487]KAJ2569389.1 hypothetical protein IW140_003092 [Coemansia sp. RSA 1813]